MVWCDKSRMATDQTGDKTTTFLRTKFSMVKDVGDQVKGSGQRDGYLESTLYMILHGRFVKSFIYIVILYWRLEYKLHVDL
ncbi:hypothetical protein L1987_76306 [Smallanthus sonchifolius]|uniref:Uncharacterized protein n=1 Tax=Smallanthus sonchifolius TaxID=185202 RepID=A0ACB9A9N4_9ASTR|nr:hypothetical protein L1987_76306 [Smallanthus sonchifolius]